MDGSKSYMELLASVAGPGFARFGSCFGSCSGQDYGWSTPKTTHRGAGGGRSHWGSLADHGYYSGADHKPAYQQPAAYNEAAHNAGGHGVYGPYAHDKAGGVWKDHVDDAGGHGYYAPYAQDKADAASKHPAAWSGKVGDDPCHAYTGRLHHAAADHRESAAAADYHHHYPTPTTTTTLAR